MHESAKNPLDEFAIDIREPMDVSTPEIGVHYPRFVMSSCAMHPDVYWARRRRARAVAIVIGSMLVVGTVAALTIYQRQAAYVWTLLEPTPQPTSIAEVETAPALPPASPPPPVVDDASIPPAPATPQAEPSRAPVIPQKEPPLAPEPPSAMKPQTPPPPPPPVPRPQSQEPRRSAVPTPPSPVTPSAASSPAPTPPPVAPPSPPASEPPASAPTASAPTASAPAAPTPAVDEPPTNTAALAPSPAPAPAPTPSVAATPSAAASTIDANTRGIQNTLATYRKAFNALDASAARQVWPTVNQQTLSRAFERLEQQEVSFEGCQIAVNNNERAEATCDGTARYVPRVGSRTPRVDRRQWRFNLVKVRDEWMIGALEVR